MSFLFGIGYTISFRSFTFLYPLLNMSAPLNAKPFALTSGIHSREFPTTEFVSLSNRWECRVVVCGREYASGVHAFLGEKYTRLGLCSNDVGRSAELLDYGKRFLAWNAAVDVEVGGPRFVSVEDAQRAGSRRVFPLTDTEMDLWEPMMFDVQYAICQWKAATFREVQADLFMSGEKRLAHLAKPKVAPLSVVPLSVVPLSVVPLSVVPLNGNLLGYVWMEIRQERQEYLDYMSIRYSD